MTTTVSSSALFQMGFAPEAVGAALIKSLGDTQVALDQLLASTPAPDADHGLSDEEEARLLAQAIAMSLSPTEMPRPRTASQRPAPSSSSPRKSQRAAPPSSSSSANPHWSPPRYVPPDASDARGPRTLSLVEHVDVRDGGYAWTGASAFLDTGNQALTLIDTEYAARHAIFRPGQAPERWTTIRGVVPGASTRAPCVTIALRVRNQEMLIEAAVSPMGGGHDLLIGADVLSKLFAAGFRIGAGSM